jgi:hypothetical protein
MPDLFISYRATHLGRRLAIKHSNKTAIPTRLGALEENLIF